MIMFYIKLMMNYCKYYLKHEWCIVITILHVQMKNIYMKNVLVAIVANY